MFITLCLFFVCLGQLSLLGYAQSCYWPDKSIVETLISCNSAATNSHCCGVNSLCLDNGYASQMILVYDTITDDAGIASIKAMNTATGYLAVAVRIEHGIAIPVQSIVKRVSPSNLTTSRVWTR